MVAGCHLLSQRLVGPCCWVARMTLDGTRFALRSRFMLLSSRCYEREAIEMNVNENELQIKRWESDAYHYEAFERHLSPVES